jgi:hypothetical protein
MTRRPKPPHARTKEPDWLFGARPEDLFSKRGDAVTDAPDLPLTEEERFRERVAIAWGLLKVTRFRDEEHARLRAVLAEMIAQERVHAERLPEAHS